MTEKTAEWYQKEIGDRFQHFYMQLDGSYNFPNSLEGDLLRMTHNMLTLMEKEDRQPTFAVGEYYSFTTYRKDYDADTTFIFKTLETKNSGIRVIEYDCHGKNYEEYVYDIDSDFLNDSMPATAEQIATFRRAEHFAGKGREWSEFRKGDIVQNTKTMQLGLVESVDEDGDAWVNYNIDKPLIYPSCCKCTGGLFLNLIQTAEELQEVGE